jgi:hypothetical protein
MDLQSVIAVDEYEMTCCELLVAKVCSMRGWISISRTYLYSAVERMLEKGLSYVFAGLILHYRRGVYGVTQKEKKKNQ